MNLSIIVKIKYLSKHLDDCIKSLISQQIRDYEIILASEKNNTSLDVFLLNILSKYFQHKNIRIVQEETTDFNVVLNSAISSSKGKYISIVNQDTLALENTYYELSNLQEEFNYDLMIFDYIKITEDINLPEVYKRYNKSIFKKQKKEKYNKQRYIKDLRESGLLFDFAKYSKKECNNATVQIKGFKYHTSKIYESIQSMDIEYKNKILSQADIQGFNIVLKRELLLNNTFNFPSEIDTFIDILKILPTIKSISSIKNTAICKYSDNSINNNKKDKTKKIEKQGNQQTKQTNNTTNLQEIIDQAKNRYKKILETCKSNINIYTNSIDIIEYYIFNDILEFKIKKHVLNEQDKQEYLKQIYVFLKELFPNYLNNKYLFTGTLNNFKMNKQIKRLEKYIKQNIEIRKLKENNIIEPTEKIKKTKDNIKKQDKIKKQKVLKQKELKNKLTEKKEKIKPSKDETKSQKTTKEKRDESKKKVNKLKVFFRKLNLDINRIKRNRINSEISIYFKKTNNALKKTYSRAKKIFIKIFNKIFNKIFKRKDSEALKLKNPILALNPGLETTEVENNKDKTITKTKNKPKKIEKAKEKL